MITVVNKNKTIVKEILFTIPNYIKTPLETIGLAQHLDLKITNKYSDFLECCTTKIATSSKGTTTVGLNVDTGPFTVIGIPMRPAFKEYAAVDLLNFTLSGSGDIDLTGSYKACEDNTVWSGGGNLVATIKAASMVKAKIPKVIIFKGEVAGSTNISETLSTKLTNLTLTADWGGLIVSGNIEMILAEDITIIKFELSKSYLEKDDLGPLIVNLPYLK